MRAIRHSYYLYRKLTDMTTRNFVVSLHVLGWIFLVTIPIAFFTSYYGWENGLLMALVHTLFNIIGFYTNTWAARRLIPEKKYASYIASFFIIVAILISIRYVFNKNFPIPEVPILVLSNRIVVVSVFTIITLMGLSLFLELLRQKIIAERKYIKIIQEQNQAEIQFLKAQINPHFLFNTLNNIYSLTVVKSDLAPKMILLLSDLLRYVIYESSQEKVALQKEIQNIERFIELFQLRQETPLHVKLEINGKIQEQTIIPMVLIPIVENCFKHSDIEINENGYIRISIDILADKLVFKTTNTFIENKQKDKVGGVGLTNIKKRLTLHYKENAVFRTFVHKNIFESYLQLPL